MRLIRFIAGTIALTLLLLGYCGFTWNDFVATVGVCPHLLCDFIAYFYPMGADIFHKGLPVDGFLYSPFNAILLAAFPPLGLDTSLVLWGILQATAVVLSLLLFYRLLPTTLPFHLLFIALTLFSYPLWLNFLTGNTSTFITVALTGALLAVERGRNITAAFLLAFAASFKFYPVIFLIPFIAGRNARFALLGAATSILLLFLIPSAVLGMNGTAEYYSGLIESFRESDWIAVNPHSQFFPHFALRLVGMTGNDAPIPLLILQIISYCIATINVGFMYLIQRSRIDHARLWSFQITFLTVPFTLKTSWECDFTFLPFVQAFLVWHFLKNSYGSYSQGDRMTHEHKNMMLFFIFPSIIFSSIFFFNLMSNFSVFGHCGFLFLADILLLIVIYIELFPFVLRQSRGQMEHMAYAADKKL